MRKKKRIGNIYWPMIVGIIIAIVLTLLSASIVAIFLDNETLRISAIPFIGYFIWVLASIVCAYSSGHTGEGNWVARSGIATGIYYVILLCVGILVFDGVSNTAFYGLLSCLAGVVIANFIILKAQKKSFGRKMRNFKLM